MLPRILKILLIAFVCAASFGCQDIEIVHDVSQRQANEIVAVLAEQGISAQATRASGSRAQFFVVVPSNRYSEAVSIIHYEGLPKLEEPSVNELLSPKGFLPNSRELENMRVDRAIAAELEGMLKTNPAVSEVKAIVRRPIFEGVGPQPPAHVSLVIRKQAGVDVNRDTIFGLVSNMVPGILPETVVIDLQDSLPLISGARQGVIRKANGDKIVNVPMKEFLGWWRVAENDYDRMILVLLGAVLGFLVVGLFVGFSAGFLGRKVVSAKLPDNLTALRSERPTTLSLNSPE